MALLTKAFAVATAIALAIACGRSEDVGWTDRERPEGGERDAAAQPEPGAWDVPAAEVPAPEKPPAEGTREAKLREYRRLVQTLAPIQVEAFQDEELAERWRQLTRDVDAEIIETSDLHRELLKRRAEIQAVMNAAERSDDVISQQRRTELAREYRSIEIEFAQKRNGLIRQAPYLDRLNRIQADVFERMRELAPNRRAEIDRLAELDEELFGTDAADSGSGEDTERPSPPSGDGQDEGVGR